MPGPTLCSECKFHFVTSEGVRECVLHPPVIVHTSGGFGDYTKYPIVQPWWPPCGDAK